MMLVIRAVGVLCMVLALAACGKSDKPTGPKVELSGPVVNCKSPGSTTTSTRTSSVQAQKATSGRQTTTIAINQPTTVDCGDVAFAPPEEAPAEE
jgi:hypothetical protein